MMTADVPPGPARRAGSGIITLARLSGRPIYPVAAASSRFKVLDTWSRLTLNLPFSRLVFVGAEPIIVPRGDADTMERLRVELEHVARGGDCAPMSSPAPTSSAFFRGPARSGLSPHGRGWRSRAIAAPATCSPAGPRAAALARAQRQGGTRAGGPSASGSRAPRPEGRLVWLHAASVGETNAILPLIEALGAELPALSFLLTTGTVTSAGLARRRLGPRAVHQYVPLDAPSYARSFLDHWRPISPCSPSRRSGRT